MKRLLAACVCIVIVATCASIGAIGNTIEPISGTARVEVHTVVNPDIIGGGVNFAFSDYKYIDYVTGKEWDNAHSRHLPDPGDEIEWKNFDSLMDYMGFQYVRLEVGLTQWEPVNDDNDPHHLNLKDGFAFSPGFAAKHPDADKNCAIYMSQMYRLLDHWEKRNLFVVLGNWGAGPDTFCKNGNNWIIARDAAGRHLDSSDRRFTGIDNIEEFTESLAAIMYHLKHDKKYKCVHGISVWNEPEQMANYYGTLAGIYNSLGDQLKRLGIRDEVKIQAFDGAINWNRENGHQPDQVSRLLKLAGDNIDIISFHDYNSCFEYMKDKNHKSRTISERPLIHYCCLPSGRASRMTARQDRSLPESSAHLCSTVTPMTPLQPAIRSGSTARKPQSSFSIMAARQSPTGCSTTTRTPSGEWSLSMEAVQSTSYRTKPTIIRLRSR